MRVDDRVNEFTRRQVWYSSSVVIRLNAVEGYWYYKVYAWTSDNIKFLVIRDKYNGEDPEELAQKALKILGLKKIKLGVPEVASS